MNRPSGRTLLAGLAAGLSSLALVTPVAAAPPAGVAGGPVTGVAGGPVAGVTAGPVQVTAAVCYWYSGQSGTSSNCDGRDPDALGTSCGGDARTVYSVVMRRSYDGVADGPTVDLRYSGTCRTVWARIRGGWGPDGDQMGCSVWVNRNSDGQQYQAGLPYGARNASTWTNVVYDAGVTSYAAAQCDTGPGYKYTGQTPNW